MSDFLNINALRNYLPHRYPFLLIDKVLELDPGKAVVAIKNVTINEPFFNGHFPVSPVMPGVLILEALAQASGLLILKTISCSPASVKLFYLAGVDHARFKRVVVPGDVLELKVNFLKERRGLWKFKGSAFVDSELACNSEFMNIRAD